MELLKIARLVVTEKYCDRDGFPDFVKLLRLVTKFTNKVYHKYFFEFILTPGGFLSFEFPQDLRGFSNDQLEKQSEISKLQLTAEETVLSFFDRLSIDIRNKLADVADYFTIGIDGCNPEKPNQHIELIAIYCLKSNQVIHWTGKFYPDECQRKYIVKVNDIMSHFVELNKQKIMILGCHDLSVYSPRGFAVSIPGGWKREKAEEFRHLAKKNKPQIVLQHPHETISPYTWNNSWKSIEKELPTVEHYASGIKYTPETPDKDMLIKVLDKTRKGDVRDFYFL